MSERTRNPLTMDGITTSEPADFQSFAARPSYTHHGWVIRIPKQVGDYMRLRKGCLLQVALRYLPLKEAELLYLAIPKEHNPITVMCPVCGENATLNVLKGRGIYCVHRKKHGFQSKTYHYVRQSKYTDAHAIFLKLHAEKT